MINLRINEEQFNEIYPDLAGYYDFFDQPPPEGISDEEFERRYLSNKLWRLNNIYTVVDKDGNPVVFRMNYSQHRAYGKSRQHPRLCILKSRQQGISTLWLVSYSDDAIFERLLNIGLMAQGKDEAATLLERVKFLLDSLDAGVIEFANVRRVRDNAGSVVLSNGSTIFIRVSFRSTTLQRLHVSEMGKIANAYPIRAREVKTGTLQALARGNTGVIESTAEGDNMFKDMWDAAEVAVASGHLSDKDFYPLFLPWIDDPDCREPIPQPQDKEAREYFAKLEERVSKLRGYEFKLTDEQKNFWIVQRRELAGDIYQEYPATPEEAFTASRDGTFWRKKFKECVVERNRVETNLYDPHFPVDVYFDIGVEDYCVMVFKQFVPARYSISGEDEYLIIDEYWNNGYDLAHYLDEAMGRGYNVRYVKFPHDVKVREFAGGNTGKGGLARTRKDIAIEKVLNEGWTCIIDAVDKVSVADGIEAVRRAIPKIRIDVKCEYLIKCFHKYSKEWDEKLKTWKKTELHDEWSHGGATLRYMATDALEVEHLPSEASGTRRNRSGSYAI